MLEQPLIATDLGPKTEKLMTFLPRWFGITRPTLHLITVLDWELSYLTWDKSFPEGTKKGELPFSPELTEAYKQKLERLSGLLEQQGFKTESHIEIANYVWEEIVIQAEKRACDSIVLVSTIPTCSDIPQVGNTASHVIHHSDLPVVMVA